MRIYREYVRPIPYNTEESEAHDGVIGRCMSRNFSVIPYRSPRSVAVNFRRYMYSSGYRFQHRTYRMDGTKATTNGYVSGITMYRVPSIGSRGVNRRATIDRDL